ncbi:MAG: hypothetical protein JNL87_02705 [Burkholderiaceae bacterium]|nr:hypothetical protein [Burkholderiaceae bacterium]
MFRCALLAVFGLSLAAAAPAQTSRPFPANALRGTLMVVQPPEVQLNGQAARLSPGSRIRGADNMVYLSGALVGHKLLVHYTLEPSGLVHDVWILTPEEAARKPWPATPDEARRWQFSPAAQTWTKP